MIGISLARVLKDIGIAKVLVDDGFSNILVSFCQKMTCKYLINKLLEVILPSKRSERPRVTIGADEPYRLGYKDYAGQVKKVMQIMKG